MRNGQKARFSKVVTRKSDVECSTQRLRKAQSKRSRCRGRSGDVDAVIAPIFKSKPCMALGDTWG